MWLRVMKDWCTQIPSGDLKISKSHEEDFFLYWQNWQMPVSSSTVCFKNADCGKRERRRGRLFNCRPTWRLQSSPFAASLFHLMSSLALVWEQDNSWNTLYACMPTHTHTTTCIFICTYMNMHMQANKQGTEQVNIQLSISLALSCQSYRLT